MERQELDHLLTLVLTKIAKARTIEQESYALLVTMFPTILAPALDILDHGRITRLTCQKSKRYFHKVKENHTTVTGVVKSATPGQQDGGDTYDVINEKFCFCYFNAKECLQSENQAMCKHILAVRLGEALSKECEDGGMKVVIEREIEDRDFAPLVLQSRMHMTRYEEGKKSAASVNQSSLQHAQ